MGTISIIPLEFIMAIWDRKKKGTDQGPEGEGRKTKGEAVTSSKKKGSSKPKKETKEGVKATEEVLVEREVLIKPNGHDKISLGQLERGISLSVEAKEVNGDHFSLYLVDLENLKKFERDDYTKGAVLKGTTIAHFEHQIKLPMSSKYYIVVTSRAVEKDRKVWVKVSKLSS
jgi:hypothetical protein